MTYEAEISRSNPTALVFIIDQSGSMADRMSSGATKSQFVADVANKTLANLVTRSTKAEGVRDYFEVAVICYGADGASNGFAGALAQSALVPISSLEANPLRVEERTKKMDDGAGGVFEQKIKFPVWFEPYASGGTPMCEAIRKVAEIIAPWCDAHPQSYPPTVLHVTDGQSTDGDPEALAEQLCQFQTADGKLLLFNLHVSESGTAAAKFPASESGLPDQYAKLLFRMSSQLPEHLIRFAQDKGLRVSFESRGFIFNGEAAEIVDFFDIGTRATQLR